MTTTMMDMELKQELKQAKKEQKRAERYFALQKTLTQDVSAYVILDRNNGYRKVGQILCKWTDTSRGGRARLGFIMYYNRNKPVIDGNAIADGCGYNKFENCCQQVFRDPDIAEALKTYWDIEFEEDHAGVCWRPAFDKAGLEIVDVL